MLDVVVFNFNFRCFFNLKLCELLNDIIVEGINFKENK